jgi:hypothetical protein
VILPTEPTVCDSVTISVEGTLPSTCYEIRLAEIRGPVAPDPLCMGPACPSRFYARIEVRGPAPGTVCPLLAVPYRRSFRVGALSAGPYIVNAEEVVFAGDTGLPVGTTRVSAFFGVRPDTACEPGPGCYILGFHPSDMPGVMMPTPLCTAAAPPGGTACVDVWLHNVAPVAGLQSEIVIHDPLVDPTPGGPLPSRAFALKSVEPIGAAKGFTVEHTVADGVVKVLLYSAAGASLAPGAGPILRLCYGVAAETHLGTYPIVHQNAVVSDPDGNLVPPCPTLRETSGRICVVRPGCDVNGDGESNILDIIRMVRCVLATRAGAEACPDSVAARADCNGDGLLDVRDVICCVRKILRFRAEAPGAPPRPIASFPPGSQPASMLGFVGDVLWFSPVDGRATLRFRPGPESGGAEWTFYADPTRVRVRDLAVRSAPGGMRLEWATGPSGITHAMLFSEGGAVIDREVQIDARIERVMGASGPTQIVVGGFNAATASGLAAFAGIDRPSAAVPEATVPAPAVYPARPNPFVGESEITFALPAPERVTLRVYDVRGRLVRTLVNEPRGVGVHRATWDGRDDRGRDLASGVYLVQFRAGVVTRTERLLRIR